MEPSDQPLWLAGLKKVLSPAQAEAWAKVDMGRKAGLEAEITKMLAPMEENVRDQQSKAVEATAADIKQNLSLPKERAEKLDALVKAAVDQSVEKWRQEAKKFLANAKESQRNLMLRQGRVFMDVDGKDGPEQQAVWKDGLAHFLSPEETKRWQEARLSIGLCGCGRWRRS